VRGSYLTAEILVKTKVVRIAVSVPGRAGFPRIEHPAIGGPALHFTNHSLPAMSRRRSPVSSHGSVLTYEPSKPVGSASIQVSC
jgi:hypothetical protein